MKTSKLSPTTSALPTAGSKKPQVVIPEEKPVRVRKPSKTFIKFKPYFDIVKDDFKNAYEFIRAFGKPKKRDPLYDAWVRGRRGS
jgi:hypothetical protein